MKQGLMLRTVPQQKFLLHQSMALLRMTSGELARHLQQAAAENPLISLKTSGQGSFVQNASTAALEASPQAQADSLYAHVTRELSGLLSRDTLLSRVVFALIEDLEPSGWYSGSLECVAAAFGLPVERVAATLRYVQRQIQPAGVFARSLAECLWLQLEDQDILTPQLDAVLLHLSVLGTSGPKALMAKSGLSAAEVKSCLRVLRRLDPKPGARFDVDPTLQREPDVLVQKARGFWTAALNRERQPRIEISRLPPCSGKQLAEARKQALDLQRALTLRQGAMLQVVAALVEFQQGYFDKGNDALKPLNMTQLSDIVGVHVSTVSRVLNGLLIESPQGITLAGQLCPGAVVANPSGPTPKQLQDKIRNVIRNEDPKAPLSDEKLAAVLKTAGTEISRRLVTKYRLKAGLLKASQRRIAEDL